jgi:hypothetical protein
MTLMSVMRPRQQKTRPREESPETLLPLDARRFLATLASLARSPHDSSVAV